jgi:hypothetical protein
MVRQIVRRDREGFEPLVPRESSARGTEGSNPSSSSRESVSRGTLSSRSKTAAFRAGVRGCVSGAVDRDRQGAPTSRQPGAISLWGYIPVPQFRRCGRDKSLGESREAGHQRCRASLGLRDCWILRVRIELRQSRARSADRASLVADVSARGASAPSDRAVGAHRESLG